MYKGFHSGVALAEQFPSLAKAKVNEEPPCSSTVLQRPLGPAATDMLLNAADPDVATAVFKTALFQFSRPVLVRLKNLLPSTTHIHYEADLGSYWAAGTAAVLAENLAFVYVEQKDPHLPDYAPVEQTDIIPKGAAVVRFTQTRLMEHKVDENKRKVSSCFLTSYLLQSVNIYKILRVVNSWLSCWGRHLVLDCLVV